MKTEWHGMETFPRDGKQYLVYSAKNSMAVFNRPPGCALGTWIKTGKNWSGYSVGFKASAWSKLPDPPEYSDV
jgi:hypothetical protein